MILPTTTEFCLKLNLYYLILATVKNQGKIIILLLTIFDGMNRLSEKWAVGAMGCRNNGPSEQWAVGIMGCRNNDLTPSYLVVDSYNFLNFFVSYDIGFYLTIYRISHDCQTFFV